MRIRLLAALGGRPNGAVYEHDDEGAASLIDAGYAEPADRADQAKPVPAPPQKDAGPAQTAPKRARSAPRG